jgi:hypothetical protein
MEEVVSKLGGLPEAHLILLGVDMGPGQEGWTKWPLSPSPAMRPPLVRRPVVRTAPRRTCLTARLRRNVMTQNTGKAGLPTPAVRLDQESPKSFTTQARKVGLGMKPPIPRLRGESDEYKWGTCSSEEGQRWILIL